jgi:ubiquitin-protein ligase
MESDFESELQAELQNLEQLEGREIYDKVIQADLLCSVKQWVRVLKEVRELNKDFHTLRTCMGAVSNIVGVLHFMMYPADGAFADKPLCGRILIPKAYPDSPPVVHLLTKTNRYNVDVYNTYSSNSNLTSMKSSMCFDVLRNKEYGGVWEPSFTLSCLIASLVQAIVSMKVPQQHGGEKEEVVSMESLQGSSRAVEETLKSFSKYMPKEREISKIEASPVPTKLFELPQTFSSMKNDQFVIVCSQAINLQVDEDKKSENVYSIGFDLSDLKNNKKTVFSIILTSNPSDNQGAKKETVLVRNGVTATAAKKLFGGKMNWFYHGKPMNQDDIKLVVSVGYDQFCISYYEGDKILVHGDCPVSFLTYNEIGPHKSTQFYLTVLMKNKGGAIVTVKTFKPEYGYLHPIYAGVKKEEVTTIGEGGNKEEETKTDAEVQREEQEKNTEKEVKKEEETTTEK